MTDVDVGKSGKLVRMLSRLDAFLGKDRSGKRARLFQISMPVVILCVYFICASFVVHGILHYKSIRPLIESMPEIGILALSTFCLSIGIPSTLLADPIVLSIDPVYGVVKLAIVTVLVAFLQIVFFSRLSICKQWFSKQENKTDASLSLGGTVVCLLFRTLPILPFGVATLYLCYRMRKTARILTITLLGSLLYYSALSWFVHASTTWFR